MAHVATDALISAITFDPAAIVATITAAHAITNGLITALTALMPVDLGNVPTMAELNAAHGGGSWLTGSGGAGGGAVIIDTIWTCEGKVSLNKGSKPYKGCSGQCPTIFA